MIRRINSIMDFLEIIEIMYTYIGNQVSFTKDGWPIFNKNCFLEDWPKNVVTFKNRNSRYCIPKEDTVICFFMSDKFIYQRFIKIQDEIEEYRQYKGVVIPDITVTADMDIELQRTIILANQLFASILMINGIKLVANTRIGAQSTISCLDNFPREIMWASGFLGCRNMSNSNCNNSFIDKILYIMPSKLLIYGKKDELANAQLSTMGINFRYFDDFHTYSKRMSSNGR